MSKKSRHHNALSFAELRCKEVVNSIDGKRLGRIIDIVFGLRDGRIRGIVVPHARKNIIFRNSEPIFIPWDLVERIGEDIILVRLSPLLNNFHHNRGHHSHGQVSITQLNQPSDNFTDFEQDDEYDFYKEKPQQIKSQKRDNVKTASLPPETVHREKQNAKSEFRPGIDCDNQCSKCMLFDCAYRWNGENK
ncbi:MAG: YlmC/YmxH family sporulation protein [Clostridiales bacterium]|jgi:YlmC/YmxH family sporulation protein|nr:YlmC/YmxH family sporulation protein [Clostridiales bacterium]